MPDSSHDSPRINAQMGADPEALMGMFRKFTDMAMPNSSTLSELGRIVAQWSQEQMDDGIATAQQVWRVLNPAEADSLQISLLQRSLQRAQERTAECVELASKITSRSMTEGR
jgi:hypothetical protein